MARPRKYPPEEGEEIYEQKKSIVHKPKVPKLPASHPASKAKKWSLDTPFMEPLLYYAAVGTSEKNIRILLGMTVDVWENCMQTLYKDSGMTYRQHYNYAIACWELKRLEIKEAMIDDEDTPTPLKYKMIQDDLKTMKEHAPANNGQGDVVASNVFSGYDIQIIRKEDSNTVNDE